MTEAGGSAAKLKLALGLVSTLRGMPQIYSGDEIGMDGGEDPGNRHDFPGGFAGDAHNAFTKAGRTATEEDVFAWTSGLLKLRASYPALQTGIEQNLFPMRMLLRLSARRTRQAARLISTATGC